MNETIYEVSSISDNEKEFKNKGKIKECNHPTNCNSQPKMVKFGTS